MEAPHHLETARAAIAAAVADPTPLPAVWAAAPTAQGAFNSIADGVHKHLNTIQTERAVLSWGYAAVLVAVVCFLAAASIVAALQPAWACRVGKHDGITYRALSGRAVVMAGTCAAGAGVLGSMVLALFPGRKLRLAIAT